MSYIYKITNDINGKIYIGKTNLTVEQRWKEHCRDYCKKRNEKRPLYDAMNKYGIEHFSVEQVEECSSEEVSNREIYWIAYYNSYHYGYNATYGGDGKSYVDYSDVLTLWDQGKTIKEIAKLKNCCEDSISNFLNNNKISVEERLNRAKNFSKINMSKQVIMIDKDSNEELKVFNSCQEAYDYLGKRRSSHIAEVCNGKRKQAYGYKWKFLI